MICEQTHHCDDMPDVIDISRKAWGGDYTLRIDLGMHHGFDEAVETDETVTFGVSFCPWCGKQLSEVK